MSDRNKRIRVVQVGVNNYGKHRKGPIISPMKNQSPVRFLRRAVCAATLFPMAFLAGCSPSEEEEAHAPGLDHFSTEATPPGTIQFSTEMEESQVSLGVYDAGGRLLRTILSGVSYPEGNHEVEWDGRDRLGEPLPEGEYQWRMLATPGFTARYIGSLGVNPTHGAPYDYTWGNLGPPTGIAAGDGFMVVSAPAENVPATFAQTLDGTQVLWTHGYSGHPVLRKVRIVDGDVIALSRDIWNGRVEILVLDLQTGEGKQNFSVLREADKALSRDLQSASFGMYSFATDGKIVALGYRDDGSIKFFDLKTGEVVNEQPAPPDLLDLEFADGELFALSAGSLVRWEPGSKKWAEVIPAAELVNPRHVAFDSTTKEWLVAERAGNDEGTGNQVKRFSSEGTLLEAYGMEGGRQSGVWRPENFLQINGIAAIPDGSGGFLVAEGGTEVRRTIRMDRAGGVVQEWFGPQEFYNFSVADPEDPNRLIFLAGPNAFGIAEMDYETGKWTMLESYTAPEAGGLFPAVNHYSVRWWPQRKNGELYLVSDAGHAGIFRVDSEAGELVPVAAAGPFNKQNEILSKARESWEGKGEPTGFVWTNPREAGGKSEAETISADNIHLVQDFMPGGVLHIDEGWNVLWRSRYWHPREGGEPEPAWSELPNLADSESKVPRWEASGHSVADLPPELTSLEASGTDNLFKAPDGSVFLLMHGNRYGAGRDNHASHWPAFNLGSARLVKWHPDGSLAWITGRAASEPTATPGHFHEPTGIPGMVRGNLVVADRVHMPASVFTRDGLYAGQFFDQRADDGLPGFVYFWWRDPKTNIDSPIPYDYKQGGSVFEHEGKVYWMPMGNHFTPVYEITGWEEWERQEGTVLWEHSERAEEIGELEPGIRGEVFANAEFKGTATEIVMVRLWALTGKGAQLRDRVDWSNGPAEGISPEDAFSIRWTGSVTPVFTEPWRFAVFNAGRNAPNWKPEKGIARVWIGEELLIDTEKSVNLSEWVEMEAGVRYPVVVEFVHSGGPEPEFSLCWESESQERQRIPAAALHMDFEGADGIVRLQREPKLDPEEAAAVSMLASELFSIPEEETPVFVDDFSDPDEWAFPRGPHWRHDRLTDAEISDGVLGPREPGSGNGFSVWRDLPFHLDISAQDLVYYFRAKTPGVAYRGSLNVGTERNWLGLRVSPRQKAGFFGHTKGYPLVQVGDFPAEITQMQKEGKWLDYRLYVGERGGELVVKISVFDPVSESWVEIWEGTPVSEGKRMEVPPPLRKILIRGKNDDPSWVDAVAVCIIPRKQPADSTKSE